MNRIKVFFRCLYLFVLMGAGGFFCYKVNDSLFLEPWGLAVLCGSIVFYLAASQLFMENIMGVLWGYVGKPRVPHKLTATLGNADRLIYAALFFYNQITFMSVYFGIKVATRLIGRLSRVPDDKSESFEEEGARKNLYLLGNIISCLLGIGLGLLIKQVYGED